MRILITGSRHWFNREAIEKALIGWTDGFSREEITIVHGGASGADRIAAQIARDWDVCQDVFVPDWRTHGPAAGPMRNQEMVDAGADVCLAFPFDDSRGTFDCMRRARIAGIEVENHGPASDVRQ